jgi:hypothetical protein
VIEKGIDVAIAVDLIYLALRRRYDALVLFSGDTDLIKRLRLTHIEVVSWRGARPLRLPGTSLPYCHYLGPADWEATTRDWTSRFNQKAPPVPEDGGGVMDPVYLLAASGYPGTTGCDHGRQPRPWAYGRRARRNSDTPRSDFVGR